MSKLEYNEIREKKIIIYDGEPCEVIESHVARTQQRKPQNQVKLKTLISGKTINATFHVSESADEADIQKKLITFLYHNRNEYWFCDPTDKSKRFKLDAALIGNAEKFLKQNSNAEAVIWENEDEGRDCLEDLGQPHQHAGLRLRKLHPSGIFEARCGRGPRGRQQDPPDQGAPARAHPGHP